MTASSDGGAAPSHQAEPDALEDPLVAARRLAPAFRARAAEADALQTMPGDLVAAVHDADLFRLLLPRVLGGREIALPAFLDVAEELSYADGSAGWTVLIGNSTAFLAWLDPAVAQELAPAGSFASTSMFAPLGRAVVSPAGGFTMGGRWGFNSGCRHSDLLQAGVLLCDDAEGPPRLQADGSGPDWRFAYFRRRDAEIVDHWDALGLRGTGSHDVVVDGLHLPEEHLAAPFFEPARHDGPLWRLPFLSLVSAMMVGFPLGAARHALDEFAELAPRKRRANAATTIAEDGHTQVEVAKAAVALWAARSLVDDTLGDVWATACRGDEPTTRQDGRLRLATLNAMACAVQAVDVVYRKSGAGAVFDGDPIQRCFRDLHTGAQHIAFSDTGYALYAQYRFGVAG